MQNNIIINLMTKTYTILGILDTLYHERFANY